MIICAYYHFEFNDNFFDCIANSLAIYSENATCDDKNFCTLDECLDGFCVYNKTALNYVCPSFPFKII